MYKLGIMSAVIFMTLFLAFKGVIIGTLILVMNLTFFAIKIGAYLKSEHHQQPSYGWSPPVINHGSGWSPHKDVHLHIHNGHGKPEYSTIYGSHGWHTNSVDNGWGNSNYVHSGRHLSENDLNAYSNAADSIDKLKSRIIAKREDKEPTIVMAEQQNAVSPYNYLNKQIRK